ncbi:mediator of RNA polymerase II transcription subunit 15-like [Actinia tenebrosa]|uniref:Mediator of RNA polymerase II transcription subunit 15 n=1 Tax=Actinia tenebrosa TaxID=6105 RepID=A0A6P8J1T9_ACTTE|nr:mediator of RNA polymerase II transcription subunit 15-like [Actinia tenebrosa]
MHDVADIMANSETEDWRSPHFRQKVTSQIDDALRKSGNPQMMTRNAADIERDVFSKAKSRDEYMCYVARVLVFARDVGKIFVSFIDEMLQATVSELILFASYIRVGSKSKKCEAK